MRNLWGADRGAFFLDGKQRGPSNSTHKYKKYHHYGYDKRYKEGAENRFGNTNRSGIAIETSIAGSIFQNIFR